MRGPSGCAGVGSIPAFWQAASSALVTLGYVPAGSVVLGFMVSFSYCVWLAVSAAAGKPVEGNNFAILLSCHIFRHRPDVPEMAVALSRLGSLKSFSVVVFK